MDQTWETNQVKSLRKFDLHSPYTQEELHAEEFHIHTAIRQRLAALGVEILVPSLLLRIPRVRHILFDEYWGTLLLFWVVSLLILGMLLWDSWMSRMEISEVTQEFLRENDDVRARLSCLNREKDSLAALQKIRESGGRLPRVFELSAIEEALQSARLRANCQSLLDKSLPPLAGDTASPL